METGIAVSWSSDKLWEMENDLVLDGSISDLSTCFLLSRCQKAIC